MLSAVGNSLIASAISAEIKPDGYGWGEYVYKTIRESNPALAERLHGMDCEMATCVIWVESEEDCRALLEATWKLIFKD